MGRSQRTRGRRFEIYTPVLLPPGPFFDVYASIFELARQNVLADPSLIEGSDTLAWDYSLHAISVEPQDAAAELVRAVVAIPCGVVTSTASSPRCGCGAGAARRSRGRPAGGRNPTQRMAPSARPPQARPSHEARPTSFAGCRAGAGGAVEGPLVRPNVGGARAVAPRVRLRRRHDFEQDGGPALARRRALCTKHAIPVVRPAPRRL